MGFPSFSGKMLRSRNSHVSNSPLRSVHSGMSGGEGLGSAPGLGVVTGVAREIRRINFISSMAIARETDSKKSLSERL